jgi:hypothetical protein
MKFNDPIPKYTTQADGTQTIEWLPPTPLMQTAQREVERLVGVVEGQQRTMTTMQEHINFLETHIQNLEKVINDHRSNSPDQTDQSTSEPA